MMNFLLVMYSVLLTTVVAVRDCNEEGRKGFNIIFNKHLFRFRISYFQRSVSWPLTASSTKKKASLSVSVNQKIVIITDTLSGFYPVNSEDYNEIEARLDDQICAVNRRTGEEKVCCTSEDLVGAVV